MHTGSPRVLLKLIEGLDRDKYNPFFMAKDRGDLCCALINMKVEILSGVSGSVCKDSISRNILNIVNLARMLLRNKINLLHINELGWNSEVAFAAWLCRIPVVFHIHNKEEFTNRNINCRIGARFLFVSEALLRECKAKEVVGSKAKVVYNPIDIKYFSCGRSIRDELNIPEDLYVVGTIAQLCVRKGINTFLDTAEKVLKQMPNVMFLIVGPDAIGEEEYALSLRKFAYESPFHKNIIFLGPRDDIPNVLACLDVFFLPTRSEPFGLVFAEAMAARVPVVASDVGGILEIIPSSEYGVTKPLNQGMWHDDLICLLKNKEMRDRLAENAYLRVASKFSSLNFQKIISAEYSELR